MWHGCQEMVSQLTSPQQEPVTTTLRYADLCGLVMTLMALLIIKVVIVEGHGIFLYSDAYKSRIAPLLQVSMQTTGKNDEWSSAHCGLRQVSPVAPTFAASLATRRSCSLNFVYQFFLADVKANVNL